MINIKDTQFIKKFESPIPHFSILCESTKGHTLILSTGEKLHLGNVHPSMIEHLFTTVKTINMLAADPKMISEERINNEL